MKNEKNLSIHFLVFKLQSLFLFLVNNVKSSTSKHWRRRQRGPIKTYIVVPILSVIVFSVIKILLELLVNQQRPLVYTGAVIFSAWYGGIWAGVSATIFSSFFIDFFYLKPYYSLFHRSLAQSLELIIFFAFGLSISVLIETMYTAIHGEQKSAHLISHILESITDAFINFDRNFWITYINHSAVKLAKSENIIGQSIHDVFPPAIANFIIHYGQDAMKNKKHIAEEFYYIKNRHWFDVDFYPAANGVTVYIADINTRKKNEERLKKWNPDSSD